MNIHDEVSNAHNLSRIREINKNDFAMDSNQVGGLHIRIDLYSLDIHLRDKISHTFCLLVFGSWFFVMVVISY